MKKTGNFCIFSAILLQLLIAPILAGQTHQLIIQPEDGRRAVVETINNAKSSVDITIYEINDPQINAALLAAKKRGVKVRIIYNYYSFVDAGRIPRSQEAIDSFISCGIQVKKASSRYEITHQKSITADEEKSIVMTFNLLPDYFMQTRDFGILTTDKKEVGEIKQVFEADWNYLPAAVTVPSLIWSPSNARKKILNLISSARDTLDIYNEEIQDEECINALIDAARRGVKVRFISAKLERSGEDLNARARYMLNANGVRARCGTSLYIHAKIILSDYGRYNAVAFVGSQNFSRVSLDRNRELGILVTEPEILQKLQSVFQADWEREQHRSFILKEGFSSCPYFFISSLR